MSIRWSDWKPYLLPEEEQQDPALREELRSVAVVGLKVIVFIAVVAVGFMLTVTTTLSKFGYLSDVWVWPDLALIGTLLLGVPFWVAPRLRKHARLAGCVIGYGVALIFIVTAVTMSAVFTKLLLNASKAIDADGTIQVRSCADKDGVVVEIEDDGRGIPAERLDQIFEPSFAVADGRVTTGNWGLFNCRSIIHSLGGEVQIESVLGAGTKVKIILPASSV